MKIVITDCSWASYDVEQKFLPADAEVKCCQISTEEELIAECKDADAILAEYAPLSKRVLSELKNLKVISNTAIGVDNIDVPAAKELGIAVCNVPGYCAYEVADHAMALMLACLRNVVVYERKIRQGIWDINDAPKMDRIAGQKCGLLGFGRIPQMVAKRAQGFDMEVYAYDPYVKPEVAEKAGVKLVGTIDEIMEICDVISCHLPLLPSTEGSINKAVFDKATKHPIFINTSRGKVIDEADLVEALKSGQIRGAGLDVIASEPADFDSDIFKMDNVVITPHAAFYSETALFEVRSRSANNVSNYLKGDYDKVDFIYNPNK